MSATISKNSPGTTLVPSETNGIILGWRGYGATPKGAPGDGTSTGAAGANIVTQQTAGAYPARQVDVTEQHSTTLACDATPGSAGNYLEPTRQNDFGSGYIPVTAVSYNATTGVVTVTCTNNFLANQNVQFNGFGTAAAALNRQNGPILAAGLSTSGFEAQIQKNLTISTATGFCEYTNSTQGSGLSLNAGRT